MTLDGGVEHHGATLVEPQTTVEWSPTGQCVTTVPIDGPREYIQALAAQWQLTGVPYRITPLEGPNARLELTFTGTVLQTEQAISTDFQFTTPGAIVPIEEHPGYRAILANLIELWASDLTNPEGSVYEGLRTLSAYNAGTDPTTLDEDYLQDIRELSNYTHLILGGTKSYMRPEPMLHVQTRYQVTASYVPQLANVGTIYQLATLIAALGIPSDTYSRMPQDGEWLAESVEYQHASDGSKVVTQTFRWAKKWDETLYPNR